MAKRVSLYQALVNRMEEAADKHPRSVVVMDACTHKILGTGKDTEKVLQRVMAKLKKGQIPVIFRKPRAGRSYIF